MGVRINKSRKMSKTVRINREALTELGLGIADGLLAIGARSIELAGPNVPDAPPEGKGLIKTGSYDVYIKKKQVGGTATISRKDKSGIVLYSGYGFPARFNEVGTVHQPARPFFAPAFLQASREIQALVEPHVAARMAKVKDLPR
jgi:HK97 gp10 family phage protein